MFPLEVSLSDKIGDVVKRIPSSPCDSKRDENMTCEGRVIRRSDDLKNCGIGGSTVQVTSKLRGGGKHKNKKSKAEKKQVTGQETVSDKGRAILESEKDEVIQQMEDNDEYQKVVAFMPEGNDIEAEQRMQCNRTALQELSGLGRGKWKKWNVKLAGRSEWRERKRKCVSGKSNSQRRRERRAQTNRR